MSVARYGLCASLFAAWLTAAALPAAQVLGVHKRVLDDGSLLMINSTNQSQHIHDAMVKSKEIKAKDVRYAKMPPHGNFDDPCNAHSRHLLCAA